MSSKRRVHSSTLIESTTESDSDEDPAPKRACNGQPKAQVSNESDNFFPYSGFGHHRTLSESSASSAGADFKMPVKKNNEEDARITTSYSIPKRRESQNSTTTSEDDETNLKTDSNSESNDEEPSSYGMGTYSSIAQKMMASMGHQPGKGLGLKGQGITAPVEHSKQRGRRGLGLIIEGLEEGKVEWDPSMEHIEIREKVQWMKKSELECPERDELKSWLVEGKRKETLDDETLFCDEEILQAVLQSKSVFDKLEPEELRKARTRSNPFETIRGVIFLNRAAMKMANLDAVFDFMFTQPKGPDGQPLINEENPLLYFADVCAGPGGFSEYVLWRKKWRSKGFGFTLRGNNDFKLEDFFSGPPETFEPHYGVNGREGDGDVFKETNILAFMDFVLENTGGKGVHFMMADGGFTVDGRENIQEILSKQLYLCQFLVALAIVRIGGNFVCKVFDLFTPFSVGLVYLMYRAFDQVCIHKPNTSRPANSERYLVCKGLKEGAKSIRDYMFKINQKLNKLGMDNLGNLKSAIDVVEIVPIHEIQSDDDFYNYIRESNNEIGQWQVTGLRKIAAFCKDSNLREDRQAEIRDRCLKFWKVPDAVRKIPPIENPKEKLQVLFDNDVSFLYDAGVELNPSNLGKFLPSTALDWQFILLGSDNKDGFLRFFLGTGRSKTYSLKSNGKWERIEEDLKFDLPANTLIYAEVVKEMRGNARSMRRMTAIHIVDAAFLGGEDVRKLNYKDRLQQCSIFAKAINKPSLPDYTVVRAKEVFGLDSIEQVMNSFIPRVLKGSIGECNTFDIQVHPDPAMTRYFHPSSVLLLRRVKEPYMIAFSKSQRREYWFNTMKRTSIFECPPDAEIDFKTSFMKRLLWNFLPKDREPPSLNPLQLFHHLKTLKIKNN